MNVNIKNQSDLINHLTAFPKIYPCKVNMQKKFFNLGLFSVFLNIYMYMFKIDHADSNNKDVKISKEMEIL